MIKKVLKKLTAAVLATVTVVTAIPAVAGSIKSNSQDIQTLSYQNEAVNDNDISYETLSPFDAELELAEEKPRTEPPKFNIAASKLSLVLVLGS